MGVIKRYICSKCRAESSNIYVGIGMMGKPIENETTPRDKMFQRYICPDCKSKHTVHITEVGLWD